MDAASLRRRDVLGALAGTLLLGDVARADTGLGQREHFLFGSPVRLVARGGEAALDAVVAELALTHREWNAWKPGGELGRLNAALRAGRAAPASAALRRMIALSARLEQDSFGFFNAGIGAAVGGWGFHDDVMRSGAAPREAELSRWRADSPSLAQLELRGGRSPAATWRCSSISARWPRAWPSTARSTGCRRPVCAMRSSIWAATSRRWATRWRRARRGRGRSASAIRTARGWWRRWRRGAAKRW
ncbi:hypothetical protein FSC37_00950 [Piscinibacter aquaticus]|uniref:Uncharacterized protein n=1 Tax=Piscinibacter aquaticus TaxID=392597 RepID=A0A5C6TY79_9BURK|nr:hypothetical protein FSC37_00950 [Piscinibacter aquaticus]